MTMRFTRRNPMCATTLLTSLTLILFSSQIRTSDAILPFIPTGWGAISRGGLMRTVRMTPHPSATAPDERPIAMRNPSVRRMLPPVVTVPMMAVPPRDCIAGSTKGLPYRMRIVNRHTRARTDGVLQRLFSRRLFSDAGLDKAEDDAQRATYTVDLHGGIVGVGEYFTIMQIGGKNIRVQVDTGSSTLAVPMEGCSSCINKNALYSVAKSTHGRVLPCDSELCAADKCGRNCAVCSARGACCSGERPTDCGFSLRYADGSAASGSVIMDEVQWGKLKANMTFGGILKSSPNFERPEVDGILGMAYKSLACNPSCFDPPFDALVGAGVVEDVFSICMMESGGKLMLGGFDEKTARTAVEYVPIIPSDTERYYRVTLGGSMRIGDEELQLPNFEEAIVDTGTTLIVMSSKTFAVIRDYFQQKYCDVAELCGKESWFQNGMCVSLSERDLARLPKLTLVVGGHLELVLRPKDYMLSYKRGARTYRCVGIMGMNGLGGMVVLGNTLMQRYVTIYDRRTGEIGFAEAAEKCGDE